MFAFFKKEGKGTLYYSFWVCWLGGNGWVMCHKSPYQSFPILCANVCQMRYCEMRDIIESRMSKTNQSLKWFDFHSKRNIFKLSSVQCNCNIIIDTLILQIIDSGGTYTSQRVKHYTL